MPCFNETTTRWYWFCTCCGLVYRVLHVSDFVFGKMRSVIVVLVSVAEAEVFLGKLYSRVFFLEKIIDLKN